MGHAEAGIVDVQFRVFIAGQPARERLPRDAERRLLRAGGKW